VQEIEQPELDARLVAENVVSQLERRISHSRAMKRAVQAAMRAGAQGIKVMCTGRLHGAEMARQAWQREGRVPLQTLRADIDYAQDEADTTYGRIGVKVWVCKRNPSSSRDLRLRGFVIGGFKIGATTSLDQSVHLTSTNLRF
jgi:small subunit ribosomal protein S3